MAQKNLLNRISRNRSSIVSQLHKLIVRYSPLVPIRERSYINRVAQKGDSLYWLEENKNVLVAAVLVERDFNIVLGETEIINIGCFVSTKPGTMDRILEHIWQDLGTENIYVLCRPFLADSLGLINHKRSLVRFTAEEILGLAPDLANSLPSYYNMTRQTLYQAMSSNQVNFYIQFNEKSVRELGITHSIFIQTYKERLSELI